MRRLILFLGVIFWGWRLAWADTPQSARFKSPSGHYEVSFETVTEKTALLFQPPPGDPHDLAPQYILSFFVAGSSDSATRDWYTDVRSSAPKSPAAIFSSLLWSPEEDYVVLTHGQNSPGAHLAQWLISLTRLSEYGFKGDHVRWIDRDRVLSDINIPKIPGAVQVLDCKRHKLDLVVPPITGKGYQITAVTGHIVTVQEFLNHWDEDHAMTRWDHFEPACFDLNLDTMKKNSVPCPK